MKEIVFERILTLVSEPESEEKRRSDRRPMPEPGQSSDALCG
jgi:hypothetical protein